VLAPLAAAGIDEEIHPVAITTAPSPTILAATFANLDIVLRFFLAVVRVADPVHSDSPRTREPPAGGGACLDRFHITIARIWNRCKYRPGDHRTNPWRDPYIRKD